MSSSQDIAYIRLHHAIATNQEGSIEYQTSLRQHLHGQMGFISIKFLATKVCGER